MAILIKSPSVVKAAGTGNKVIKEYFGRVNSNTPGVSIAKMDSPQGWEEPAQTPEFNEYTVVLKGALLVRTINGEMKVNEGEALLAVAGERIQYSTPFEGGAEYLAVCLPAFSPDLVHRDQ